MALLYMTDRQVETKIFLLPRAYDEITFPSRKRESDRNARKLLTGRLAPYTAHYLHQYLPLDSQNPANVLNSRNRRPTRHRILPN